MFALLRLVSLRHVSDSPLRTAITVMGVAVGVATLVGISSINRSVTNAFRSTIDTVAGKADVSIAGTTAGFPEELLEQVRAVKGVQHAAGTLTVVAPVKDSPGESLYVMGIDFLDDGYFRSYEGVDRDVGKLNDDLEFLNSTDRLLVSERFAKAKGLTAGSTLQLLTKDGAKDFVVHGLLKESGPVTAFGGSVGVMFFASAQEAFGRGRVFDRIDVKVDPAVGWEPVVTDLRARLDKGYEIDRPDSRGASVETMVRSFQLGLNLGSAVALLVGVFLVYNTVSISVLQRRREIGTLRALGTTKQDIRLLFAIEAAALGAVGSVIGIPFGLVVGRGAISWVSDTVSQLYVKVNAQDVQLGAFEMAVGAALGVVGSIFAALRPAVVASGVQPVEALRRDVAVGAGAVQVRSWPTYLGLALFALAWPATFIEPPRENMPVGGYICIFFILMGATLLSPILLRHLNGPLAGPGQALWGFPGRLAADNFARAPVRTSVPVSALSVGVAMSITVASFITSFQSSAETWIRQAIPADLFVTSSAKVAGVQNQPMASTVGDELAQLQFVDAIDRIRVYPADVLGLRVFIISLTPEIYERRGKPTVISGSLPTPAERERDLVTVSENFARRRKLSVGDRFEVSTPTGVKQWTVGAVIIDYTSDQGSIIIERKHFIRQFQDDQVDSFHVYVDDSSKIEAVRQAITARFGKAFDLYVLSNVELRDEAMSMVGSAFKVTYAMELVAVLLALLGIVNTLLAAVLDRTREIGLLRAIGADRRHVLKLFAAEASFIGLTGGLMGVAVGAVVGFVLTKVVGVQATGWSFPFQFPWPTGLTMLLIAIVASTLAGLYPARRASQLDVVEALAYE
ncbi:MAG: FtsX-like permease family protein [Myxococcaceae bacterium]|nr:FtsX-like permease family protein [Myxococcaceae bacterium]